MLNVRPIKAFSDNYIWLIQRTENPYVAVVDPGDPYPVIKTLESESLSLAAILITHHHGDHVGGIDTLTRRWPVPVYGPAGETIDGLTHRLRQGDSIRLAELGAHFDVLDVPGHTAGHIAYAGHGMLFCGDTLFTGGCGRLFEGTPAQMYASLKKIARLPANTLVYCAHEYTLDNLGFARVVEPESQDVQQRISETQTLRERDEPTVPAPLELELRTNPFLRCHLPHIRAAATAFAGTPLETETDVFATVRYWKDTLD